MREIDLAVIVGVAGNLALVLGRAKIGPQYKYMYDAGVPHYELRMARQVFQNLDVRYSPTWIVRHRGRDYIFEGFNDPSRWFSKQGEFNGGN